MAFYAASAIGGQPPADVPVEVAIYELAKKFHALPSAVMKEPAVLMRKMMAVAEAEGAMRQTHERFAEMKDQSGSPL